mmetsp:Transcript_12256/g.16038  ORF Transcript_12256/g.16038 Transcript_12256/m.16038 type:complete len:422 (-) Transcript_12256:245-1510(-)
MNDTISCEACGWMAAFCSALAFGSFGVPIKSKQAMSVDVDPLVFQSYKTIMVFLTSWLVLLGGEELSFSPWGIVSAAFWVPGGIATVYAIKTAGLAIGIGVGACFIVLVSFIWGIFIFQEHVHSHFGASFAIFCMIGGLCGMAYYSSPESTNSSSSSSSGGDDNDINSVIGAGAESDQAQAAYSQVTTTEEDETDHNAADDDAVVVISSIRTSDDPFDHEPNNEDDFDDELSSGHIQGVPSAAAAIPYEIIFGRKIAKRKLGILAAALVTGVWGGSILVPMKWAKSNKTQGVGYLISFAIGALIITTFMWIVRLCYNAYLLKSFQKAYDNLPSFHIKVMWLPGGVGGLLWSIGNFFSLISVYYLGEGVGYPLVQTSILVSGLWGIFYFQEITGARRISSWFLSASLAVCGILLLSYEHHEQ